MLISFTIQRREKEDQKSESESRYRPSEVWSLDGSDLVFKPQCSPGEIDRTSRTEKTEDQIERYVMHRELGYRTFEGRLVSEEDV